MTEERDNYRRLWPNSTPLFGGRMMRQEPESPPGRPETVIPVKEGKEQQ